MAEAQPREGKGGEGGGGRGDPGLPPPRGPRSGGGGEPPPAAPRRSAPPGHRRSRPGLTRPGPRGPCRSRPPPAVHTCLPSALASAAAGAIFPHDRHPAPAVTSAATCGPGGGARRGEPGRQTASAALPPRGGPARPRSPTPARRRALSHRHLPAPCRVSQGPMGRAAAAGSPGGTRRAPGRGVPYRSLADARHGWGWGKRHQQASSASGS